MKSQRLRSGARELVQGASSAVDAGVDKLADWGNAAAASALQAAGAVKSIFDHDLVDGIDGYVAVDETSHQVVGGDTGGVRVADERLSWIMPKGLSKILAFGESNEDVSLTGPGGASVDSGRTNEKGFEPTTVPELQQLGVGEADPTLGKLIPIIASAEGRQVEQKVQALPKGYDGPIFVSDIDDTLRDTDVMALIKGAVQGPIAGATELLEAIAARGVPIIYLSAGPNQMGAQNDDFLAQLPPGVLLARQDLGLKDMLPMNSVQAKSQGDYKTERLKALQASFPNARFFGIGDDKYGDANAYASIGAQSYIRDVRPGDDNIPENFSGVQTTSYDEDFRNRVLSDVDAAIAESESFKKR